MAISTGAALLGGAVLSGFLGADAASNAADAQSASAQAGINETRRQFDLTRADFAPYREIGTQGLYTLADYLGIGTGRGIANVGEAPVMPTREQFTKSVRAIPGGTPPFGGDGYIEPGTGAWRQRSSPEQPSFDEVGYNAAMEKYLADKARYDASMGAVKTDSRFGSLLHPFTGADLASEPGYQFGLSEGEKAIDRSARGAAASTPARR